MTKKELTRDLKKLEAIMALPCPTKSHSFYILKQTLWKEKKNKHHQSGILILSRVYYKPLPLQALAV